MPMLLSAVGEARESVVASGLTLSDWITAGAVLAAGLTASQIVNRALHRAMNRGDSETEVAAFVARGVAYLVVVVTLTWTLSVLGVRLGPLVGALGVGGLAVALATQNVLSSVLASLILRLRRPFRKGDQVSTYSVEGTVEAVSWRTVELRTFDGERAFVPCAEVLSTPVINYTAMGRRRTTLCLEVGYEVDLEQARDVLLSTLEAVAGVLESPEPEVWLEQFTDSGVKFALRFWHAPDAETFWRTRSEVGMAARHALAEAGIEISGPEMTLRFK
jgi:small conductance mechanosensitive channel